MKLTTILERPQSDEEVADLLSKASKEDNEIRAIEAAYAKRMRKLEKERNRAVRRHNRKLLIYLNIICSYLDSNREDLVRESGGKTVEFDTGKSWWRLGSPSLWFKSEKGLIKKLKKLKLTRFIRTEEHVKKQELISKMLSDDRFKVPGTHVIQHEELYIRPQQSPHSFKRSELPQLRIIRRI